MKTREHTIYIAPDSFVKSVTITNGGAAYATPPTVTFTSVDGGYGATGVANISGGSVVSVSITNVGSGYLTAPTVTFTGGGGASAAGTAILENVKIPLDVNNDTSLLTEEGFGMAPIEYITQRAPYQHGESLRDYFLRPRIFQLLVRKNACSRNVYWDNRLRLVDLLRPNRSGSTCAIQGTLRRITTRGQKFDIKVVITEGPGFNQANDLWDKFAYHEVLRFVANDPVFYNPSVKTLTTLFTASKGSQLVFPITFPISAGYYYDTTSLVNYGTWRTYPTIDVYGPVSGFAMYNNTTGKYIAINYTIPNGSYVSFNLEYGRKAVQLNDGTNLIGYALGDIASFCFEPGNNALEIQGSNIGGATQVVTTYYERYIGI